MTVNESLRAMAGIVVLVTLALGYWVSPYWYLFTAFVGLNLFIKADIQPGSTNHTIDKTMHQTLPIPNLSIILDPLKSHGSTLMPIC